MSSPKRDRKSVYQLIDPRDSQPRHTAAAADPFAALRKHLQLKDPKTSSWIGELERAGVRPDLRVIALDTADWRVLVQTLESAERFAAADLTDPSQAQLRAQADVSLSTLPQSDALYESEGLSAFLSHTSAPPSAEESFLAPRSARDVSS